MLCLKICIGIFSCADQGIFIRGGGGGGPGQSDKNALATLLFSPQFILQKANG